MRPVHAALVHGTQESPAAPHQICCWNAHGLKPYKLQLPGIDEIVQKSSILVFTETWLEGETTIPDSLHKRFTCHGIYNERACTKGRNSGGVLVCVRNDIAGVSIYRQHQREGILWLKFTSAQHGKRDLYMAACYFPPAGATHYVRNDVSPFDVLMDDILDISNHGDYIIIGDLNARTGCDDTPATDTNSLLDMNTAWGDDLAEAFAHLTQYDYSNIPARSSSDTEVNSFGRNLLQLCSSSGACILNGRIAGDLHGACTYKSKAAPGSSLVDYYIATPSLFFDRNGAQLPGARLKVDINDNSDFRDTSDHYPVTLSLPHGVLPTDGALDTGNSRHRRRRNKKDETLMRWVWDNEHQEAYVAAVLSASHTATLESILVNEPGMDVGDMISTLISVVQESAAAADIKQRPLIPALSSKRNPCDRAVCPWYKPELEAAHRQIKLAPDGSARRQAQRKYRKLMHHAKHEYSCAREAKLADMLKHKPQQFWQVMQTSALKARAHISKQRWLEYYRSLRQPPADPHAASHANEAHVPCFTEHIANAVHATSLNLAFSIENTNAALTTLKNGKTADSHGIVAELFTKATVDGHFLLAPYLTHIINCIFESGNYPDREATGMIISIFKGSGDDSLCTNYRGITIITVISKLYATMLNERLSTWRLESADRHARGQGGFLKNHRTTDHMFIMQHVIDKYRAKSNKPLYTCFVDLSKAFDTVNRDKLWRRLDEMGIRGTMLTALKAYYANVKECVKTHEGLTESFESGLGVKQGCPLSPTLFGLYIDALENFMCSNTDSTVEVGTLKVPLLLYADDIVFFATSENEMQHMMDVFSDFCYKYELTVNMKKTEAVVFSCSIGGVTANIRYRDTVVPQKLKYRYLGVWFDSRKGIKLGGEALFTAARYALFELEKHMRAENIYQPHVAFQLFDALVAPILTYGSEIWGCYDNGQAADTLHLGFIKRVLRLPLSTDTTAVLAESGRLPFHCRMWENQVRYWKRLRSEANANPSRLLSMAFHENLQRQEQHKPCWAMTSTSGLNCMGLELDAVIHTMKPVASHAKQQLAYELHRSIECAGTDSRDMYAHHLYQHATHERRRTLFCLHPSQNRSRWFWEGAPAAAMELHDAKLRAELIRFRLGAHGLRVVTGAWKDGGRIERRQRLCRCCRMDIVEDEYHAVFECHAYTHIRNKYQDLFQSVLISGDTIMTVGMEGSDSTMHAFFGQNQQRIAEFIRACRKYRVRLVSFTTS